MRTQFVLPGIEMRLVRSRLSDVLSRRVALRTSNLPHDVLKTTLGVDDVVSRCGKAMGTHFLQPAHRTSDGRICDVLNRPKDKKHNPSSRRLKKRQVKSMKRCFKVSKGHANSFSASRSSKKETWTNSLK
jgi:hypothetical protein